MRMLQTLWHRHAMMIILGILLGVIVVIVAGCLLAPTLFYDQWIWKYYWGPVVADASGHSVSWHGVTAFEGYTLVSEVTYGIILVCALYGLYQLLKKLNITIDWYFCLALIPYILFGPVTRVLEDTSYFTTPFVYWFISPLIYIQTTLYVLFFLFLGSYLLKKGYPGRKMLLVWIAVFILIDLLYSVIWFFGIPYGAFRIDPSSIYVISLLSILPVVYPIIKKRMMTLNTMIFSGGLFVLLPFCYLIGQWLIGPRWSLSYGVNSDVFLLVLGLVTTITAAVYSVAWIFRKHESFAVYMMPLNLSMLVGHLIDGFTSYISIYDPFNMGLPSYVEKHPASNGLMELWPPLFPIVKFLLIILIIYLFDIAYKKELQKYTRLVNLLKIGIFILGVSPGLRDLLRVTMGV
jgi:uncharacterized membrane protein